MNDEEKKIKDLQTPITLPQSEDQTRAWQQANYEWWQKNPMRYDWGGAVPYAEFSTDFYEEIDRRFFDNARDYLDPRAAAPFEEFIHFDSLKNKDVLEIGVGNGSHIGLLASRARSFVGMDLTDYAVRSASRRMEISHLPGKIVKMDGEHLRFPDGSFDFVWSWGVIHHSANTVNILKEIYRVLRPGGEATIMVYHRGWWNYYVMGMLQSIISGALWREKSLTLAIQSNTDGAIARYYSFRDWRKTVSPFFRVIKIVSRGPKTDLIPLPRGSLKSWIRRFIPNYANLFLVSQMRMGGFLVSQLAKK